MRTSASQRAMNFKQNMALVGVEYTEFGAELISATKELSDKRQGKLAEADLQNLVDKFRKKYNIPESDALPILASFSSKLLKIKNIPT